jgi:integrase/recombinase XerD
VAAGAIETNAAGQPVRRGCEGLGGAAGRAAAWTGGPSELQPSSLESLGIEGENKKDPLFLASNGRPRKLSGNAMTSKRNCELVKRWLKDAGLPSRLSPHSFRVTAITSLLEQGVPMEDLQYLAGHAELRTTMLYDRRKKKVTRNIVERIPI